jgi:uncharacterized protein with HEPN domain
MSRNWIIRIKDALQAISYIETDIDGMTYDEFASNRLIRQATERNIEVIGVALNNVPTNIQDKYCEINWRNIISMRNFIAHQYFDVIPDIEWEVAVKHVKILEKQLKNLLQNEIINDKSIPRSDK